MSRVSIVLPTYNGEKYLSESIESVLNQTYKDFELIIVNDASTDNTLNIAEEYAKKDKRIKIISHFENKGISDSINDGFEISCGEYRSWTSDDNYYELEALQEMVKYLDSHPNCDMVYTTFNIINLIKNTTKTVKNPVSPLIMIAGCPCGACFLYKTDIAKKIGGYNKNYPLVQDYEYWLRLYLHGNIEYLDKNLYTWRLHKNSQTSIHYEALYTETLLLRDRFSPLYKEKFPEETTEFIDNYLIKRGLIKAVENAKEKNRFGFLKKIYNKLKTKYKKERK